MIGVAISVFHLLGLTPLLEDRRICSDTSIDRSGLGQFVQAMVTAKASVENILDIEVRSDIYIKPVQQLGSILGLIGLKLERVEAQKDGQRKIYRYRVEPQCLDRIKGITQRRKAISPTQFASKQYGWSDEDL